MYTTGRQVPTQRQGTQNSLTVSGQLRKEVALPSADAPSSMAQYAVFVAQ